MKIQEFLKHHGISRNPFAEEDAQTDFVFKDYCIDNTFHVGWDKIFGDPHDPSTSIVFGEKGAGKTAIRLQIAEHVSKHNRSHPDKKLFVVNYDDFNPFLDQFREHFGGRFRRTDKLLGAWRLWDHMDAILSLGVTKLVDQLLSGGGDETLQAKARSMPAHLRRDLALLSACYDQSRDQGLVSRWSALCRRIRHRTWRAYVLPIIGVLGTLLVGGAFLLSRSFEMVTPWLGEASNEQVSTLERLNESLLAAPWWLYLLLLLICWLPWLWKLGNRWFLAHSVVRRLRTGQRHVGPLRKVLMSVTTRNLLGQPLPNKDRTDDRYELLAKLQNVLEHLGYSGMLVLVDRVDEPHLINGQTELMRALLWPLLDNKFLKHPGIGLKMMFPIELRRFIDREDRDFYQKARLDKQNMIPSLQWTGAALYDLASARIQACATDGKSPTLRSLFDESVSDQRLIEGFRTLRVPRHLFKFLYRLLVDHCNAYTDDNPKWEVSNHMFESVLAVYSKEIELADAGTGV